MEIKIGVVYTPREIVLETDDDSSTVSAAIESAFTSGDALLWLTDTKGRRVAIPTDKIAYVEIGSDAGAHQVGFGVR
jgi:hypothetical protein